MESSKIKFVISLILFGLIFIGCGAGQLPPQTIPLSNGENKIKLIVPSIDLVGSPIQDKQILDSLGLQLSDNSSYEKKTERCRNGGMSCPLLQIVGVSSMYSNSQLSLIYTNGENYKPARYEAKDIFNFPVSVQNDTTKGLYNFLVQYPSSVISNSATDGLGKTIKQLDTLANLDADAKKLFTNLMNKKIPLNLKIDGEINTKFNNASIYANFERKLGVYIWKANEITTNMDITKEKYFIYKFSDGKLLPLHIKVYPYQDGSKIVYDIVVPYWVDMKGGMSISKQDIDTIRADIIKIAND